jgi:acyl-[acyl-carrier-protein]-phospholipid O-acyltransferase/long-chain-fatty-acid--[acyl-carrier-protein] ligase
MIKQLMSSRRFAPLFWAQFFSALNDNVLKNALVIILLYGATAGENASLVTLAGAVFIFPFFVLSALGGELADKYVKSIVARRLKFIEIFAACFAAAGFFLHSVPLLFAALALFGTVAALFGPVKYAILPDQLSVGELATGNALVEGATFLAILIGTIAGGLFVAGASHMGWISLAVVGLSVLSWAFAARVPVTTPSAPRLAITANPLSSTVRLLKSLYAEPRLWDGMVIVSWFWLAGAVVLSLLPALIKEGIGGTEGVVTLCLATFAIGIAAGSLIAAQLSHVRPNLALVPIGAIVMGLVGLDLAAVIGAAVPGNGVTAAVFATSLSGLHLLVGFFLFAIGGGLFVVPSFARAGLDRAVGARPDRRGWQHPAVRLHGGGLPVRRTAAICRAVDRLDLLRPCRRQLRFGVVCAQQVGQGGCARFRRRGADTAAGANAGRSRRISVIAGAAKQSIAPQAEMWIASRCRQ